MAPVEYNGKAAAAVWLAGAAMTLFPADPANAQISYILCGVWAMIACDIGRGIATLAIAGLSVGAIMGKVSWGMAVMIAVGMVITFGAAAIANSLTGTPVCSAYPCSSYSPGGFNN